MTFEYISLFLGGVLLVACAMCVYRSFVLRFHRPRWLDVERDSTYVVDDESMQTDRLLRLRRHLGVDMAALPAVKFRSSGESAANTDEGDNEEEIRARRLRAECLTVGVFLSDRDEYVDCRSYCHVTDGVDYKYYSRIGSIVSESTGRVGSYCMPTDAAACNENTSIVVYGRDAWRCLPRTRAFAGEGGNKIVVCNGTLLDRGTGILWRDHIDATLLFRDIDEPLVHDTQYRFVCPPDVRDTIGNKMIESPHDRLQLVRNHCAASIPSAASFVQPNFTTGECICRGENDDDPRYDVDPISKRCVPSTVPFSNFTIRMGESDCLESWSTEKSTIGKTPCGIARGNSSSAVLPTWRVAALPLFDRPVISHLAMRDWGDRGA